MEIAERTAHQKKETRELIVAAARRIFLREGRDGVSMRKIASEMEYSPTTIYRYFRDKAELLRVLLEDYYERILARMDETDPGAEAASLHGMGALAVLRNCMHAYVELGLANPPYYDLAFMSRPRGKGPSLDPESRGWEVLADLTRKVRACMRCGALREMDPDLVARVLWAVSHGATSLLLSIPEFPWVDRERLIDCVIDGALNGLRPAASVETGPWVAQTGSGTG